MTRDSPFPISARNRSRLDPEGSIFDSAGAWAASGVRGARLLAFELNRQQATGQTVRAGSIHALGLLHRVLREVLRSHRDKKGGALASLLEWLQEVLGEATIDSALLSVAQSYPPAEVLEGGIRADQYLIGTTDGIAHRLLLLEELFLIWWINRNPALEELRPLFDDSLLQETAYTEITSRLLEFFAGHGHERDEAIALFELVNEPMAAAPESLRRQVEILAEMPEISSLVPDEGPRERNLLRELLVASDLLREEEKASFVGFGPAETPEFSDLVGTPRRLATDSPWMKSAVLCAKHVHVWLHQLSVQYGVAIEGLHEIPRAALEDLVALGCTDLWLIGIWARSPASRQIKRLCGNPEAEASAYSVVEYLVADELGGDEALRALETLADEVGLRLATDMVPNHTGLDSRWIIEKPDYFLGLDEPPYPSYRFEGPDLCQDSDISIHLEDHYYDRSDAAVVFRREDHRSGEVRYIYHGNDGTGLPWSDTAQLNYLNPEVREAVIEEIVAVARRFPVVRFDAAMTLTQQHFHRLWYPAPGTGGDIPSRAEHGVDDDVFLALMPEEFWLEVAQRLQKEAPDTLLVAEAFWLLEGYFVRSLGIHRVYNSAFMHMLREEDGSAFRRLLRGALTFDSAILSRFVNFLSNPDEETARQQFGSGPKYFAAASLLATLPGTPMFAHGQIGGLAEKYGMEYRRAYRQESDDPRLVERHKQEILPLLRDRSLFSGSSSFELFDFLDASGAVNESVIAFTNRNEERRCLVVCNYSDRPTSGKLGMSSPRCDDVASRGPIGLNSALQLEDSEGSQVFELLDPRTSEAFVVRAEDLVEHGLSLELNAFQVVVVVLSPLEYEATGEITGMAATIQQEASLAGSRMQPALDAAQETFSRLLLVEPESELAGQTSRELLESIRTGSRALEPATESGSRQLDSEGLVEELGSTDHEAMDPAVDLLLRAYRLVRALSSIAQEEEADPVDARSLLERWNLGPALAAAARSRDCTPALCQDLVGCLRALLSIDTLDGGHSIFEPDWIHDPDVRDLLRVHGAGRETWIRREGLQRLLWSRFLVIAGQDPRVLPERLVDLLWVEEAARRSGYRLDALLGDLSSLEDEA